MAIHRLSFFGIFILLSACCGYCMDSHSYHFDFGLSPIAEGYLGVSHQDDFSPEKRYGWIVRPQFLRDRGAPDDLYRDFVGGDAPAKFHVELSPGLYRIKLCAGDITYGNHRLKIRIPQLGVELPVLSPTLGEYVEISFASEIKEPFIEFVFDSPVKNWVLNSLSIEPASQREEVTIRSKSILSPSAWDHRSTWPNPVQPLFEQFRKDLRKVKRFTRTGLTQQDYLKVIEGNVEYFKQHLDETGAIIDPYKKEEYQYSTPCFALAAATVAIHAGRGDLIEPAARAMDWAVLTLSEGRGANHHEDFFSSQIAHALPLLRPVVSRERYQKWEEQIRAFDPLAVYRAGPGGGNWNVVALSGEGLFFQMHLRENPSFIESSLAAQSRFFNSPWGLYTEGPMPYDHFPRIWAADMLSHGYRGQNTAQLEEVLNRGALTSLFMQSPTGELPAGGRSAHHQWNEAEQCVTYEIYAAKALASGDQEMAEVYKRAAHLALASLMRWIRPSGELWIVKNRVDPSQFHGYEGYSSHSQYNLLAMAMLSIAYEYAVQTGDLPESPTPADVGGFAFQLPSPFNKVFANAGGMYLEIDYIADLHYNATGLIRVHRSGFNPQLGPSDAVTTEAIYHVPEKPAMTAAIGVSWQDASGEWVSLAQYGRSGKNEMSLPSPQVTFAPIHQSPRRVAFKMVYEWPEGVPSKIVENYSVTPDRIEVDYELTGYFGPTRLAWPVLASDGERTTEIGIRDSAVSVSLSGQAQRYRVIGAESIHVQEELQAFRNGWARIAVAQWPAGRNARLRIQPDLQK